MSDPAGGLGDLFRQAQELQEQLLAAQERATEQEIEGQAGGGAVRVTMTGGLEVRRVRIEPSAVDPDDISMLEDLVMAATRDALERVREVAEQAMGGLDVSPLLGGFGASPGGPSGVGGFGESGDLAGLAGGPEALPGAGFRDEALPEREDEASGGPSTTDGGGAGGGPDGPPGGDKPA